MQGGAETLNDFEIGVFGTIDWQYRPLWYHVIASILEFSLPWSIGFCMAMMLHRVFCSNKACNEFRLQFIKHNVPLHNTILMWALQHQEESSIAARMSPGPQRCVCTEENTAQVLNACCGSKPVKMECLQVTSEITFTFLQNSGSAVITNQHKQQRVQSRAKSVAK